MTSTKSVLDRRVWNRQYFANQLPHLSAEEQTQRSDQFYLKIVRLCAVSALIVAGFDLSENRVRTLHPIIQAVQFTYQTVDDEDRSFGIEVCKSVLNVLPAAI